MKFSVITLILLHCVTFVSALTINEVMSNPTGDDSGREWIEIYNPTGTAVDISALTISIKGGAFVAVTPVSGGTTIQANGYAIIGSTVTGATKFALDYPAYTGPLLKSSISLVNTGVTSIELKSQGTTVDSIPSYIAAKEGSTYSLINGAFVTGIPTPGEENKPLTSNEDATTTPGASQTTIAQMSSPSADIVLYLPSEKLVVAGAPSPFSVYSLTKAGKAIDAVSYTWSFGDGGEKTGSSTLYRYFYPGRYIAQVEGYNGLVAGVGRMVVRVVAPDLQISSIKSGKYGSYVDITNPNTYDLDLSGWKLSIDGALYSFPKNTLLPQGVTHFSGLAMGFASTTVSSSTLIKLHFPSMDEVLRVVQGEQLNSSSSSVTVTQKSSTTVPTFTASKQNGIAKNYSQVHGAPFDTKATSSQKVFSNKEVKDTRIASFFRSFFTSQK